MLPSYVPYTALVILGPFPCIMGARVFIDDKRFDVLDNELSASSSQHIGLNEISRTLLSFSSAPLLPAHMDSSTSSGAVLQIRSEELAVKNLSLALGVVSTVFGIVLISILWWMCRLCRRRAKSKEEAGRVPDMIYYSPPSPASMTHKSTLTGARATVSVSHSSIDERTAPTTLCGASMSPEHEYDTAPISPEAYAQLHTTGEPYPSYPQKIYAPFPVYTRSSEMAYSTDPPSLPLSPADTNANPSMCHSQYPSKRASTSSYYEAADEVVGAVPRRTSTSDIYSGGSKRYGRTRRSSLAADIPYRGPLIEVLHNVH